MATGIVKTLEDQNNGTTQVISNETGEVVQGQTIPFYSATPVGNLNIAVSDRITFDIELDNGTWRGENLALDSKGTNYTTNHTGNITVGSNDTVFVHGEITFDGNVTMDGGVFVLAADDPAAPPDLNGSITGTIGFVSVSDATVSTKISVSGTSSDSYLGAKNATVSGTALESNGVNNVEVDGCDVSGDLSSTDDTTVSFTNNDVDGDLTITGATNCTETGNTVAGTNSGCPSKKS